MPCPASTRLMRQSTSGQQTTTVNTTSTLLVPQDLSRVALVISAPATNPMWLGLRQAAADGVGIRLAAGQPPLVLTLGDHGALVQGPIYAAVPAGAEAVTVWYSSVGHVE